MAARNELPYWSSCCGQLAEYIGHYRCTGCKKYLNLGRAQKPHLLSTAEEAARIREAASGQEVTPDGRLF